ncbi:MAG TPA: hypothetical protein VFS42_06345 [Burkholderiaceae bacterium]|nr:hypothetical protein [Burkholderiaceae bacterium]
MATQWEIVDEMQARHDGDTASSPPLSDSDAAIAQAALRCRRLIKQRALVSSAASLVPLPGFDTFVDVSVLMKLFADINAEFGLTPEQIERLSPHRRALVYQAVMAVGSTLIGRVVTRELVLAVLRRLGARAAVKHAARYVPFAGQAASAALSFGAVKWIGEQHVRECMQVARTLLRLTAST